MSRRYVYPYKKRAYYARHRTYEMDDGQMVVALTTRYTWKRALRPCEGPRGGRAYKPFYRNVYYYEGRFYRSCTVPRDEEMHEWYATLMPVTGWIQEIPASNRDTRKNSSIPVVDLYIDNGVPTRIRMEDSDTMELSPSDWPFCAELLGLEAPGGDDVAASA